MHEEQHHHDHHDHHCGPHPRPVPGRHSRPFVEPDWIAQETDDQLPTLSTIGRGPIGEGVSVQVLDNTADNFSFRIFSDKTGETIVQSPNLSAGVISVNTAGHEPVPGEIFNANFNITRGGATQTFSIPLPPGIDGARLYSTETVTERDSGDVYSFPLADIAYDSNSNWASLPVPRVNDMLFFATYTTDINVFYLSFGHIVAVENEQVIVTARTYVPIYVPWISEETGTWFIGANDTGVKAQGPQGIQGPMGQSPWINPDTETWFVGDEDTGVTARGDKGDSGATPNIGPNGNWFVDEVDTGVKAQGPHGAPGVVDTTVYIVAGGTNSSNRTATVPGFTGTDADLNKEYWFLFSATNAVSIGLNVNNTGSYDVWALEFPVNASNAYGQITGYMPRNTISTLIPVKMRFVKQKNIYRWVLLDGFSQEGGFSIAVQTIINNLNWASRVSEYAHTVWNLKIDIGGGETIASKILSILSSANTQESISVNATIRFVGGSLEEVEDWPRINGDIVTNRRFFSASVLSERIDFLYFYENISLPVTLTAVDDNANLIVGRYLISLDINSNPTISLLGWSYLNDSPSP